MSIDEYTKNGIKGDLNLSYSDISSLPEGLEVKRDLFLSYCSSLKSLPKGLKVHGSLVINKSAICSLPADLFVAVDLIACFTSISSLPDNLSLKGYLDLTGSSISSLPKNLKVGKGLLLSGTSFTKVSSLPLDLEAGAIISDYFDKSNFLDYRDKALRFSKELSKDFDLECLEDFS